jgi:hypothetical protein
MSAPEKSNNINGSEYQRIAERHRKTRPLLREECCFNCREKYAVDENGCAVLLERIVAERPIFNPGGFEVQKKTRQDLDGVKLTREQLQGMTAEEWEKYLAISGTLDGRSKRLLREAIETMAASAEVAENAAEYASNRVEYAIDHGLYNDRENKLRAARRARRKVSDYVMAEHDFRYFITLTLNGKDFPRNDLNTAVKRLQTWLKNRVQREGLKYIIVPEYHADGESLHFHGFINEALRMEFSGTVVPPGGGKPIKVETARRKGFNLAECQRVYNIPEWLYGYTTAIKLYGEKEAAAAYIAKYITKQYDATDGDRTKIGGRYYWHSNNLREPVCRYINADFENWPGDAFDTPGGQMKIEYFTGGKPNPPEVPKKTDETEEPARFGVGEFAQDVDAADWR